MDAAEARIADREELLSHWVEVLQADSRIVAAMLYGSLGRGAGDAWSDIDLWVVVEDKAFPFQTDAIRALANAVAVPLLVMEFPYNGPSGGTFFHTLYDGPRTGAQNVDVYVQPQVTAAHFPGTRPLFDRAGLRCAEGPPAFGNPGLALTEQESILQEVRFFWIMLLVCAKYVARNPFEERMGLLSYPVNALSHVRRFCGEPLHPTVEELSIHPAAEAKVTLLNALAGEMAALMPNVKAMTDNSSATWGISPRMETSAFRFLQCVGAVTRHSS